MNVRFDRFQALELDLAVKLKKSGKQLLPGASAPVAERFVPARDFSGYAGDARTVLSRNEVASADQVEAFLVQDRAVLPSQ